MNDNYRELSHLISKYENVTTLVSDLYSTLTIFSQVENRSLSITKNVIGRL